jgi:predicted transcriptional regulator
MSDTDDLLGKADAFLKRYRASGASAREDVPVLTEVIAESAAQSAQSPLSRAAQAGPTKAELQELEQRLKQSILDSLGPYVATILEEQLRSRLEAHLQLTLPTLSSQVKADIETLIREAVARAVELEIARVRGPSRGG